jgi:hypothetical protein
LAARIWPKAKKNISFVPYSPLPEKDIIKIILPLRRNKFIKLYLFLKTMELFGAQSFTNYYTYMKRHLSDLMQWRAILTCCARATKTVATTS